MVDLGQVVEVRETASVDEANALRRAGWVVLGLSQGQRQENGEPCFLYSFGRTQRSAAPEVGQATQSAGSDTASDFLQ